VKIIWPILTGPYIGSLLTAREFLQRIIENYFPQLARVLSFFVTSGAPDTTANGSGGLSYSTLGAMGGMVVKPLNSQ
jgi:hypothetical protein